jgi:hypothetical protein
LSLTVWAEKLLIRIAADASGKIFWDERMGHLIVMIGRRPFIDETGARMVALWTAAFEELKDAGLVKPVEEQAKNFELTHWDKFYNDARLKFSVPVEVYAKVHDGGRLPGGAPVPHTPTTWAATRFGWIC